MKFPVTDVEAWSALDPSRVQRIGRALTRRIGRWLFRYRGINSCTVPESGGFLLAPNHGSFADGFIFLHGHNRSTRFMAKYQALDWFLIGRIIAWGGGFPVRRGVDAHQALAIGRRVIERGHGLVVFMEGRLIRGRELGEPRSGLARLALETGAPVVPVAAAGTKPAWRLKPYRRAWRRPLVRVAWGEPLQFERCENPTEADIARVRDAIWSSVQELYIQARDAHDAALGRHPDPEEGQDA